MTRTPAEILASKFYTWQMDDGRWHSSPYTNARDVPISYYRDLHGRNTEREAKDALKAWAAKATAA